MFLMFILDMMEGMRPDLVAPVVLWLCHDSCTDTGSVIEAAAGWVGKCELIILCLNHVR
jgi:3-hydroxyacyl-CoA dehydrogenase/3a,7a,12a-trihydroxy-5b-cholest-24-enoyl-CoA hydratase